MSNSSFARSPRFIFVSLALLILLSFARWPQARSALALFDHGMWFLDSYGVLASSDAHRAGIEADAPNPYDKFNRSHKYSDWWYVLGDLGLTRKDNFLVGGIWVLAFLAAVFLTITPRSRAEACWLALMTCSPPVMLGILRANSDLVVFVLLALALLALRRDSAWRTTAAIALLALATGLKFYPAAAALVFLLVPSSRRMRTIMATATIVLTVVLATLGTQILRGTFHVEPEIYTLGGRILLLDFGLTEWTATVLSILLAVALAMVAMLCGWTKGLARQEDDPESRRSMVMGGVVLFTCFLLAVNFGYRWIFALWLAPWLWENRARSVAARLCVWILPFCLWHDGLLCLATLLWFPNLQQEQYDHILVGWRFATEPFTWLLMILLGGWLLELILARWREVRGAVSAGSGAG